MGKIKGYETRSDWVMREDMDSAPLGVKLLLLNPGGVLVQGVLSQSNRGDFKAWSQLPKTKKSASIVPTQKKEL